MKLNEILELEGQQEWQKKRNPVTSLPELWYENKGGKPYKVSLVGTLYRWLNENSRMDRLLHYDSIDHLNTSKFSPLKQLSLPEISEEKASWLYDNKFVRIGIITGGGIIEASIPYTTLLELTRNEFKYDGHDSKEDLVNGVKDQVRDFIYHNFTNVGDLYGRSNLIRFTSSLVDNTEKMIENFVVTRKYTPGEY